jgi:hypothetical protein
VTDLDAHGIAVTVPTGWEGRVFKRPVAGEVSATAADGPPAPPGETTNAVAHLSTIPLPPGIGDFGSEAVPDLGLNDVLVVLFEYDARSADQPLFARAGVPRQLSPDDFSPGVLQRAVRGQAGAQIFCHEAQRAFCLYVVLGSFANRQRLVPRVNEVLAALDIAPVSGATTAPPPSTTTPAAPGTAPTTTSTPGPLNTTATTDAPTSTTTATVAPPRSNP